jgi:hypothetical protein
MVVGPAHLPRLPLQGVTLLGDPGVRFVEVLHGLVEHIGGLEFDSFALKLALGARGTLPGLILLQARAWVLSLHLHILFIVGLVPQCS